MVKTNVMACGMEDFERADEPRVLSIYLAVYFNACQRKARLMGAETKITYIKGSSSEDPVDLCASR